MRSDNSEGPPVMVDSAMSLSFTSWMVSVAMISSVVEPRNESVKWPEVARHVKDWNSVTCCAFRLQELRLGLGLRLGLRLGLGLQG